MTEPDKDAQGAELKRMAEETIARLHLEHPNSDPRLQGLTLDEICALALLTLSRARSAGVTSEWQPIETAPKDESHVLVVDEGVVSEARFVVDSDEWWLAQNDPTDAYGHALYPTHWRPMPEPPALLAAFQKGQE